MTENMVQSISTSSDRQAWTVASSTPPQTIASSVSGRPVAVPVVDLTAQDSPMISAPTIEYVASSPRPESSISSEEMDLEQGLAQARAIELHLAAEEAEQARIAIAARREAAVAHRLALEAKARSSRNTSRTSNATRTRGTGSRTVNRAGDDHAERGRVADSMDVHERNRVAPELPELQGRARAIPGAGVWDFLFPSGGDHEGDHDEHVRGQVAPRHRDHEHRDRDERRREAVPQLYDGTGAPYNHDWTYEPAPHGMQRDNRERDRRADEQLRILKKRIAELEAAAKDDAKGGRAPVTAGAVPSESSGFQTPRQSIDAPLIDLSSPPKKKDEGNRADISLLDMPTQAAPHRGEHRGMSRDRGGGQRYESPNVVRRERSYRASRSPERDLGNLRPPPTSTIDKSGLMNTAANIGRMDLHPLMVNNEGRDAGRNNFPDPPPGLGAGLPRAGATATRTFIAPPPQNKVKEADEVKIPALPEMGKFTSWKQQVRDNVMSASGRGRDIYPWILEAERMEIDFESLADTAGLDSLDVKLSAAINRVKKGRIEKMLTTMDESYAARGEYITGRQKLRVIYQQFEVDKAKGQLYDLRNLTSLEFPGDDRLEALLDTWDEIVNRLSRHPGEDVLREILCPLLEESTVLKGAMDIYHLADPGTPQRSYDFLHRALTLHVDKRRQKKNREDTVEAMNRYLKSKPKLTMPVQTEETQTEKTAAPAKMSKGEVGPCYAYLRGTCTRGDKCKYAHDGKEGSLPPMSEREKKELADKRAQIPCKLFVRGQCKFGAKCQYKHDADRASAAAACVEDFAGMGDDAASVSFDCEEISGVFEESVFEDCSDDEAGSDAERITAICREVSEWIIDTGTENHLVTTSKIDPNDPDIHKTDRPLRLATANGTIVADRRVKTQVPGLGISIDPLMLDKTVDAISVGRLVMDDSFSFHWPNGEAAYFQDRDGNVIPCTTRGYVPVIAAEGRQAAAAPGVAVQVDGHLDDVGAEISRDERLRREARTAEHCLTHMPKNPFCWVCSMSKMVAKQARRLGPEDQAINPTAFGEHVCADHITGLDDEETADGNQAAMFIMDMFTRFPCLAPVKNKSASSAIHAIRQYIGKSELTTLYTDNSGELEVAAKEVAKIHATSTPYRPQSNSLAERGIRTLLEATRASLVQAGLPCRFWPMAGSHQAFAIAICDRSNGEMSPFEKRNGEVFDGWRLPFGSLVHYRPPRPVMQGLPKFAPRSVPGIFVGWHLEPGCLWKGDYLVIPLASFREAGKKRFHAHRIKELVSFDAMEFPLQAAYKEKMSAVEPTVADGGAEWPDQVEPERDEEADARTASNIDKRYKELFGDGPPADMGFEEKLDRVMQELFGSDDDAEPGEESPEDGPLLAIADAVPSSGENKAVPEAVLVPRGRKILLPKRAFKTGAVVQCKSDERNDREYMAMVANEAEPMVPVKRRKITQMSNRRLVEFCCSKESLLGRHATLGCLVTRLTIENDLTTEDGLQYALDSVNNTPNDHYVHLWASLPCTAGSPWQRMNRYRNPEAGARIEKLMNTMYKLLKNFSIVAERVLQRGGDISFEWPTACTMWNDPEVMNMIDRFSLNKVNMHGCAAGLKSSKSGLPVKKPWTIATTAPSVIEELSKFQCPGHDAHQACQGNEVKKTEAYTPQMAAAIHRAIREQAVGHRASVSMSAIDTEEYEHSEAARDLDGMPDPVGHREKIGQPGLWCAMVTKTLRPSDPMTRHPGALKAVQNELDDLRSHPAWDEEHPVEASDLIREQPDAHVARVFPIIGIKNFEDPPNHLWKGRIVVAGNNIKTASGQWALFQDMGAVPSTMAACRTILAAYSVMKGAEVYQSDCVKAYVQAEMKGTPTYVRLPKAWWPPHWVGRYRDPLCRLLRALYGHPDAGNQWADKIGEELHRLGFTEPEGWAATYVLRAADSHVIVFVLYVDDLIMFGTARVNEIIAKVRINIKMDDPTNLQKYLGVVHHIMRKETNGEVLTEITFDMEQYFRSAVEDYIALPTGRC